MAPILRVWRRMSEDQGRLALPMIVVVGGLMLFLQVIATAFPNATVGPAARFLDWWLLLVLGVSYLAWSILRARGRVDPDGQNGFVLSAFGLWARYVCNFFLYTASETYGGRSVLEATADDRLRFLIAAHRYGGLFAFALGLALVAWGSRCPPIFRLGRATQPRSGSPPSAGPEGRAPRADVPPS